MPCDWTHHLKQEWTLDQFVPEVEDTVDVDELLAEVDQLITESEVAVQHSERIRSSKQGTASKLSSGESRRSREGRKN